MSTENINETIFLRRERRIAIKLHKSLRRQHSNSDQEREFMDHSNSPPVFEAGDDISGVVGLKVKGGQPVAKVRLALVCLSQVRWHIYGKRKSVISAVFSSENNPAQENQIFFDRKQILQIDLGKGADSKWTDGKYEFPFRMTLPYEGLASTMKSCHGFIKYTIEVFTVDDDQNESRGEKEIAVVAPIQEKLDMHGRSLEKSLHILGSGKITITGSLERKEYVPGEVIPVEVITVNDSNIAVQPRVALYQTQVFACNQVHRTLETCLTDEPYTAPPVSPNHSITQIIKVPLSTNLVVSLRCPLITVRYFLHVTMDIPHSMDLNINLPFVVTTRRARASNMIGYQSVNGAHLESAPIHSSACHQQTHPNVNKSRVKVNNV